MSEDTPKRRLFILEFDLDGISGHFFNQVLGMKLAAETAGFKTCVLLRKDIGTWLADPLDARQVIEIEPTTFRPGRYDLDRFAEGDRRLRRLWGALDGMAISRHDIVLITSGRPVVVYSLGAWLSRLDPQCRPAVFLQLYDPRNLDPTTMQFSEQSWMERFAARDLGLRPGQERVFLTVHSELLVAPLEELCLRRVFYLPLPMYYGEFSTPRANAGPPTIYAHMNARCGAMLTEIESVIRTVLDRHPQTRFLVKYCRSALNVGAEAKVSADLAERGVELIPVEQTHPDYLRTIERSDIVFLPYEAGAYAGMASGVFAEGVALGKVMVVPGNTWLARTLAKGHAAGVSFAPTNSSETTAAVLRALDMLPALTMEAQERSAAFRAQHSSARNLESMLSLADEAHNMRPGYALGRSIVFDATARMRGYMGGGWSDTGDNGVWTTGPSAELFFCVRPSPTGPLVVRARLAPFIAKGHSQSIAISVNGIELSRWDFPDDGKRGQSWHEFMIPSHVAAQDELNIQFRIQNPVSPKQLGISGDRRALGACFYEIVIDQADG